MKWLAIINPKSGYEKDEAEIDRLCIAMREALGRNLEIVVTERIGQAIRLARERHDVDGFIGVGGDGTMADLINGMDLEKQILGVLPAGTGNGLAKGVGLFDGGEALERLAEGHERRIDLIRVHARFLGGDRHTWRVVSTAALGFVAETVEAANNTYKPFGWLCYPLASLHRVFLSRRFTGRWRVDGGPWKALDATAVIVNNTSYAGSAEPFPLARPDDGEADVLVTGAGALGLFAHAFSVWSRRHFYATGEQFRARQVMFDVDEGRMLMLDGEILTGVVGVSFTVEPGRLRLIG